MLSFKQSGIKYHFLSFMYDATWNWTRTIGEHSTLLVMNRFKLKLATVVEGN